MTMKLLLGAVLLLGAAPALAHNPSNIYRPKAAQQTAPTPGNEATAGAKTPDETKKAESTSCHCPCMKK